MSIGSFLLGEENLELVRKNSWKFGRPLIIDVGLRYYREHPEEVARIAQNLEHMGLPSSGEALEEVLREIVVHYYEKAFVLTKTYEAYWIAKNRIDVGDSLAPFIEARETGKAVFVGQAHFGATYLMGVTLMVHGIDIASVGRFPEPVGSMLTQSADLIAERHGTGRAQILNLSDKNVDVPTEMIHRLLSQKAVSNVYDEHNQFCRPQTLLGRRVMGGTGMDLILKNFDNSKVIALTAFLVRTSDETFRYEVDRHDLSRGDIIESFYRSLDKRIREHHAQWYFIHELHKSLVP